MTPDPNLLAAIADDVIAYEEAQNRHYGIQPQLSEDTDDGMVVAMDDALATGIFPPDMIGVQSAQHVMKRLMRGWDHYSNKPRHLKNELAINDSGHPYRDPTEEEAKERKLAQDLARIINVPRITAKSVLRMAYDDNAKLSRALAHKIDVAMGLNGELEQFAVEPDDKDPDIIDMPFKMHWLTLSKHTKAKTPDHGTVLRAIFREHGTNAREFSLFTKMTGLNADVLQHVAYDTVERSPEDHHLPEPILGKSASEHLDKIIFGKQKNGPFIKYYNKLETCYGVTRANDPAAPYVAYHAIKTEDWAYDQKHPTGEKVPVRNMRQMTLERKRRQFYRNLAQLTDQTVTTPLELSRAYDVRWSAAMGLLKPNRREKNIIKAHPELKQAGLNDMHGILSEKKYISPEYREKYFTMTDIFENYKIAGQVKSGWKGFVGAMEGYMANVHDMIKGRKDINADTAIAQVFYPITGYDAQKPRNDKNGGEAMYITKSFITIMKARGVLTEKISGPRLSSPPLSSPPLS